MWYGIGIGVLLTILVWWGSAKQRTSRFRKALGESVDYGERQVFDYTAANLGQLSVTIRIVCVRAYDDPAGKLIRRYVIGNGQTTEHAAIWQEPAADPRSSAYAAALQTANALRMRLVGKPIEYDVEVVEFDSGYTIETIPARPVRGSYQIQKRVRWGWGAVLDVAMDFEGRMCLKVGSFNSPAAENALVSVMKAAGDAGFRGDLINGELIFDGPACEAFGWLQKTACQVVPTLTFSLRKAA